MCLEAPNSGGNMAFAELFTRTIRPGDCDHIFRRVGVSLEIRDIHGHFWHHLDECRRVLYNLDSSGNLFDGVGGLPSCGIELADADVALSEGRIEPSVVRGRPALYRADSSRESSVSRPRLLGFSSRLQRAAQRICRLPPCPATIRTISEYAFSG